MGSVGCIALDTAERLLWLSIAHRKHRQSGWATDVSGSNTKRAAQEDSPLEQLLKAEWVGHFERISERIGVCRTFPQKKSALHGRSAGPSSHRTRRSVDGSRPDSICYGGFHSRAPRYRVTKRAVLDQASCTAAERLRAQQIRKRIRIRRLVMQLSMRHEPSGSMCLLDGSIDRTFSRRVLCENLSQLQSTRRNRLSQVPMPGNHTLSLDKTKRSARNWAHIVAAP